MKDDRLLYGLYWMALGMNANAHTGSRGAGLILLRRIKTESFFKEEFPRAGDLHHTGFRGKESVFTKFIIELYPVLAFFVRDPLTGVSDSFDTRGLALPLGKFHDALLGVSHLFPVGETLSAIQHREGLSSW
jgi:hypothetical protein